MSDLIAVEEVLFVKNAPSPAVDVADLLPYSSPQRPDVLTPCEEGVILLQFHVNAPQPNPLLFGLVEDYDPIRIRALPHPKGGYVLRLVRTSERTKFVASLLHVRSIVESIREVLFYERVRPAIKTMLAQLRVLEHAYCQFVQDRLSASLCSSESNSDCQTVQAWLKFMAGATESYTRLYVRIRFPFVEGKPLHLALPLNDLLELISRTIQQNDPAIVSNLIDSPDKEVGRWKDILARTNLRKEAVMCDTNGQLLQTAECGPDVPVVLSQFALTTLPLNYAIEIFTGTSPEVEGVFCQKTDAGNVVPLTFHIKWPLYSGWAIDHPGGALTAPLDPYSIREEGTAVIGPPRIVGEEPTSYFLSDPLTAYSLDYQRRALDIVATSISRLLRFTSDMVKEAIRQDSSLVLRLDPEIKRLTNLDSQVFEEATGDMRDPHYLIKLLRYELARFANNMKLKAGAEEVPTLGRRRIEELQDAVNIMYALRNSMAHGRHMHKFVSLSLRSNDRVSTVLRCAELIVAWICHIFSADTCEFTVPLMSADGEVYTVVADTPLLKRRRVIDCLYAIKSIQRSYFGSRIMAARQRKIGKMMNRKQLLQTAQAVTAMLSERFEAAAAAFDENSKSGAEPNASSLEVLQTAQTFMMCFVPRLFPAVGLDDDVTDYQLSKNSDNFVAALMGQKPLTWGALASTRARFGANNGNGRRRRVSINAETLSEASGDISPRKQPGVIANSVVEVGEAWDRAHRAASASATKSRKRQSVRQPTARKGKQAAAEDDATGAQTGEESKSEAHIERLTEPPRTRRPLTRRQRRRKANLEALREQQRAVAGEGAKQDENDDGDGAVQLSKRQQRKARLERKAQQAVDATASAMEPAAAATAAAAVEETKSSEAHQPAAQPAEEQKAEAIIRAMAEAAEGKVEPNEESEGTSSPDSGAATTARFGGQPRRRQQGRRRRFWKAKSSSVSDSSNP